MADLERETLLQMQQILYSTEVSRTHASELAFRPFSYPLSGVSARRRASRFPTKRSKEFSPTKKKRSERRQTRGSDPPYLCSTYLKRLFNKRRALICLPLPVHFASFNLSFRSFYAQNPPGSTLIPLLFPLSLFLFTCTLYPRVVLLETRLSRACVPSTKPQSSPLLSGFMPCACLFRLLCRTDRLEQSSRSIETSRWEIISLRLARLDTPARLSLLISPSPRYPSTASPGILPETSPNFERCCCLCATILNRWTVGDQHLALCHGGPCRRTHARSW